MVRGIEAKDSCPWQPVMHILVDQNLESAIRSSTSLLKPGTHCLQLDPASQGVPNVGLQKLFKNKDVCLFSTACHQGYPRLIQMHIPCAQPCCPTEPLPRRVTCVYDPVLRKQYLVSILASWSSSVETCFPQELTMSTSTHYVQHTHAAMGLPCQLVQRWEYCLWLDELLDFLILKILSIVMVLKLMSLA